MIPSIRQLLPAAALLAACGGSDAGLDPVGDTPARIAVHSGNAQTVELLNDAPFDLFVRVTDADGLPVPGVSVRWETSTGGLALDPELSGTDRGGKASTSVAVGRTIGTLHVQALVVRDPSLRVTFDLFAVPAGGGVGDSADAEVFITETAFVPQVTVIERGLTVQWNWSGSTTADLGDDSGAHGLDFDPDIGEPVNAGGTSPVLRSSGTWRHTFSDPGTYNYRCSVHPSQTGTVVVN